MTVSNRHKTRCRYIGINNWKRLARHAILQTSLLGKEQLRWLSEGAMCRSNGVRLIAWILLIIIKDDVVHGQTSPNAVALVKGEAMLDCTVSLLSFSQWTHTTDGTINPSPIASGCSVIGGNSAYYRTEQPGGNICRLIIANATMQLAGVYICFDGSSITYRSLFTVIDPVASVVVHNQSEVVDGDQLNVSCSINYNGPISPAPSLRPVPYWTTSPEQIFTNATYRTSTNIATSVATIRVKKPTVPIFRCNTVFEVIGNTTGYNPIPPPDNLTVGVTPPIDVQYPIHVGNITSEGRNSSSSCGISTVVCIGTANPAANYSWVDMEEPEKIIATNQSYNYAEYGHTYGCKATNYIRGHPHTDEANYTVQDQYRITPCKTSRTTNMNITGESCSERKCDCLLDCNMTIHCHSDAYPEPSYYWKQVHSEILKNSTILKDAPDGIYYCVAKNIIEGKTFEAELSVKVVNCRIYMIILIAMMVCFGCSTVATCCTVIYYHSRGGFNHLIDRIFPFPSSKKTVGDTVSVGATDSIGRPGSSVPSEGSGLPGSTGPKHHLENDDKSCLRMIWTVLFVLSSCVASGIAMAVIACCCFKDKKDQHKQPLWLFILIQLSFFVVVSCLWIVGGVGISPCVF